ncbi:hypothetical protein SLEP1_g21514 [Rubroshorea leprosula]|uniref:Uncharacterized protein n=1 Tax=Rubroshorea leprosula TaxID=152421 RepID=A0AAV5J669_9ROSI|nr:hypothetical protein SLEP1_g21514 [Rubroshorea leprosula]
MRIQYTVKIDIRLLEEVDSFQIMRCMYAAKENMEMDTGERKRSPKCNSS